MKTIKEINKKFREYVLTYGMASKGSLILPNEHRYWYSADSVIEIGNIFITKQILSLIEELEGKLPKKSNIAEVLTRQNDQIGKIEFTNWQNGFNSAIDQMRASIKEFFEIED